MKALYSLLFIIALTVNSVARPPEPDPTPGAPNEGSALQYDADNQIYHFKWWGRSGRTYFLQSSQDLMQPWNWIPVIETGEDAIKEWAFTSTADMFFVRLRYTDRPTYDPINEDFDGDGVSNILEVQQGSDPFDFYSQSSGVITPLLSLVSGDNQSTTVDQYTAQPVVLLVTNTASTPLVNAPVTVNAGVNAFISSSSDSATITNSLVLRTNTQGQAIAYLWFQGEPGARTISYQPEGHATPVGTISAQVLAAAPIAPNNVTATRTYTDDVQLSWNDNSSNETGFTLYRSDDNGATWTVVANLAANTTTYTLAASNAANLTTLFRAQASNSNGSSASSNQASNVPPKPAPRYAVIDLGSDHTHVMKIANSGHVLARGNGTSIAGWRWYNDEWSALTHSEENGSAIDMNNSGTVLGSCAKTGKGWKDTYWSVSIKAATWAANSTTAALSPSATGSAYYNDVLVSEGGAPQDPVDIRQPFGIDDNGAVYSCDVSGNDPYADPPPSSVFTDYAYTLGSEAQSVHKTVPFGWDFPTRIGPVCTAGCVQSAEPDYEYTYDGATLDFTPIDINNDGAVVGDTSIFHGGSTETLPATALAINNRHYPPGDTGASDWQIISDTTLIEKERNDDGSPGANYKSIPITDLIDRASTQTYSGFHLADINDQGAIVATAQKAGATHAVLLLPVSIVRETEKDSGKYERLSAMPVFHADDGVGSGISTSVNYDNFSFQVNGNLSSTAIDTMTVSFTNTSGSFSGMLAETGVNTGVFQSSGNTFTLTLSPVITTSNTVRETLTVLLTSSTLGLNNSSRTAVETEASTSFYAQPQMDVGVKLSAALSATQPDTVTVSLQGGNAYSLTVTETAADSKVFKTSDETFNLTISNYTGLNSNAMDSFDVTLSGSAMSVPLTYHLVETGINTDIFTNFTVTPTNITPVNPSASHDGVFYIKIAGSPGQSVPIKLKSGDNEITVQATAPDGVTDYLLSPPILLQEAGESGSYSGINTLALSSTDPAAKVEAYLFSSATANVSSKKILPAFLGAALGSKDWKGLPPSADGYDHFDKLDRIIGRKTANWIVFSTPSLLGYSNSTIKTSVNLSILQEALPKYSIFYLLCHGAGVNDVDPQKVEFYGDKIWGADGEISHLLTADEISSAMGANEYNLVFLNSCASACDSNGVATAYANAFKAKNYVGWLVPVTITTAGNAAITFFTNLDNGKTVKEASLGVNARQSIADMSGIDAAFGGTEYDLERPRSDESVIIDLTPDKKK